jgi:hypothetical protein
VPPSPRDWSFDLGSHLFEMLGDKATNSAQIANVFAFTARHMRNAASPGETSSRPRRFFQPQSHDERLSGWNLDLVEVIQWGCLTKAQLDLKERLRSVSNTSSDCVAESYDDRLGALIKGVNSLFALTGALEGGVTSVSGKSLWICVCASFSRDRACLSCAMI